MENETIETIEDTETTRIENIVRDGVIAETRTIRKEAGSTYRIGGHTFRNDYIARTIFEAGLEADEYYQMHYHMNESIMYAPTDDQLLNTRVTPIAYEDSDPAIRKSTARQEDVILETTEYRFEEINHVAGRGWEWRGQYLDTLADMQAHIDHEIASL